MNFKAVILSGYVLCCISNLGFAQALYSFKGDEKVLDIGCGEGDSSLQIAKVVRKGAVIGVDFSKSVIEKAKSKHLQSPSHLSFRFKEFQDFNFSETFDVITCYNLNQSLYSPGDVFKKAKSLLKPQGYLELELFFKVPTAVQSTLKAITTEEKWSDFFLGFDPNWNISSEEDYQKILCSLNFSCLEIQKQPKEQIFACEESFDAYITSWLPYLKAIPDSMHPMFVQDFKSRYLSIFPKDKQGNIHFLVEKLNILAQKN
jgi:trans-aconitate 2-methyltransferase